MKPLAVEWATQALLIPKPKLAFLRGEMGSGKTTFVSEVANALGADDAASPSFALHTRYESSMGIIDHFDLDRLTSIDDLESTGFWDIISEAQSDVTNPARRFVMIEWANRLDDFGAGTEGAVWTKAFSVSSLDFSGPPAWRVVVRLSRL